MKTKILSLLAIVAFTLGFASCSEDWEPKVEKTGQVSLKSMGVDVRGEETVARAEYDLNDFMVKIYKAGQTTGEVASWTYSNMPEIFTLPVGSYRVDVISHDVQPAEWERPLYKGSANFEIKNGEITAVGNVVCRFASLRVSVKFSEKLILAAGNDINVKVEAGEFGSIDFTATETRSAYFEVVEGSNTLAAYFEGTINGYHEQLHKVYDDVAAGQHRIITFTLKGEILDPGMASGILDITNGISISAIMSEESLDGSVPVEEDPTNPERPGKEEFNDDFAIDYSASSNVLTVKSPNDLASLKLSVASDNADATAAFSSINGVDLLNPGAAASDLAKYGLTVTQSRSVSYSVDLTGLNEAAKEFEGNHTFTFSATDVEGSVVSTPVSVKGASSSDEDAITFDTDLDFEGVNSVDVAKAVVVIGAEAGLAHLNVTISSDNNDFIASAGELLPLQFDLAEISGDTAASLASIGLPTGSDVKGKTSVDFNITDLVPLLSAFPGTHKFTIAVEDMAGNSATRTLTFVAN